MRAFVLAATALVVLAGQTARATDADVAVVLELSQAYYYEGDPVLVRVTVRNAGPTPVDNPVVTGLLEGLKVRHAGGSRLRPAVSGDVDEPDRPDRLAPVSFYGARLNISGMFPQTLKSGHYELMWEGDGLRSRLLSTRVIPRFEPRADYLADVVTPVGTIRVDLFEEESPIAVRAFVDLARSGYYDGLAIDEVRRDQLIVGGQAPKPFVFPAEQSKLPIVQGMVILKPLDAAPPTNGSGFMILLAPEPALAGQVTVLGRVVQGLETAIGLSRVPSSGPQDSPPFRPIDALKIEKVLISKQKGKVDAFTGGSSAPP